MRVMVLGLRGFPEVQGGVETHAEHLYPLLAKMDCDVEVVVRTPYSKAGQNEWKGVCFQRIWSPRTSGVEAFIHTFLGVLYAGLRRPDILHIHAIGPAIMTPLARFLGLKVVVTHHGPDYDREKWGRFARWVLRTGERMGMRFATRRIVISRVIEKMVRNRYCCESSVIPNGVVLPTIPETDDAIRKFSLVPRKYVLLVSRMVPEKRHVDLISAFGIARPKGWKLVLVGDVSNRDAYVESVLELAQKTPNVVVAGFRSGRDLQELYAHAGFFVLPSSHEGLPIAMLEALSYGLPVVASDIPANLEVGLQPDHYFPLGDVPSLAESITRFSAAEFDNRYREQLREAVSTTYCWDEIAKETRAVYEEAINSSIASPSQRL